MQEPSPLHRHEEGYWEQYLDESEYAPQVAGVPAIPDYDPETDELITYRDPKTGEERRGSLVLLDGVLSRFRCPSCKARLSRSYICLNACHLGGRGAGRFHEHMRAALGRLGP